MVLRRTVRKNLLMDFQEKERLCHQSELSIYLRENLGRKKKILCIVFTVFISSGADLLVVQNINQVMWFLAPSWTTQG